MTGRPRYVVSRCIDAPYWKAVMAISVISISSDSSEDSVGTPAGRVILFASPDYLPASDSEYCPSEDPSSDHIPPLPAISPFLSSDNDTTDSDTPDTPPSPTHVHMMTARKRVGPLPTHCLAVIHSTDHSSLDSSSKASSDFHSDASFDPSSRHPLQIILHLNFIEYSAGAYVARDVDVEVDHREISLRDDAIVRVSDEPHLEQDSDPEIHEVERVTHPAMPEDIPKPAQEGAVEAYAIEGVQREQGHRIVGVESAVIALTERIAELERDNMRLRGTASVESQRVDRLQRGMSRMQRELRQMRRLRFYDRVRVGRLEACARKHMGYRP
ncbi:hypothetical protein Tco_0450058 [Tanacetum coccineum]